MSAIQSSVGLITGIPIQDTVDQLISISARPRDLLTSRTNGLRGEQSAVDRLSSLVLSLKFSANKFKATSTFNGRAASSSSDAVGVTVPNGSTPNVGSYQFTPLQAASSHQLVSASFEELTDVAGDGTLNFGFGGHVDTGLKLSELNNGAGVKPGSIKITDRNGDSEVIDLRAAQSVDDVIRTINASTDISVSASVDGDSFKLTDLSGGTGSLSVKDIGLGTTAAGLGLAGLSTTSDSLTGADVYSLHENSKLSSLNDGSGIRLSNGVDEYDLKFTLRDATTELEVSLTDATSLGDVIDAINDAEGNEGKLTAAISGDGRGITVTDNTGSTAGNLIIENGGTEGVAGTGKAADLLGIATDSATTSIAGKRLVSGLKDSLISSLGGGQGFELGTIDITDRLGASASVDLSAAETLGEAVDLINAAGVQVTAQVNDSRNGIALVDNSGGTGNLTIADNGSTTTATDLGIAVDAAVASVNSGSLNRQSISEATLLENFNGGKGVKIGDIRITDSAGTAYAIDLNPTGNVATTIGDVIDKINSASNNTTVTASINATGDGIQLTDSAGGEGTLTVTEVGNGQAAADLNLLGASTTTNGDGDQIIDGTTSYSIDLTDLEEGSDDINLSTLNNGNGVDSGVFEIFTANSTDESEESFFVNLGEPGNEAFTVNDVIDKINTAAADKGVAVTAQINSAGTGIEIIDSTGGEGNLKIEDRGSGTTAVDLKLTGTVTTSNDEQKINGRGLFSAADAQSGPLDALVERINSLDAGVTASIVTEEGGFRLAITADNPGAANELIINGSSTAFGFQETSRPADAVALFGSGSVSGGGFAVRSTNNKFNDVIDGVDVSVNEANGQASTIDVSSDDSPLLKSAQDFVAAYNSLRSNLDQVTDFDAETNTTGILFGRNEALRVDTELSRVISGRIQFGSEYGSLESVGISLDDKGKLSLDSAKLSAAFADDPSAVERLFTDEDTGAVTKLNTAIDRLAGDENSLLSNRSSALQRTIDNNQGRIEDLTEFLGRERERVFAQFVKLEQTIALLQSNTDSLSSIQPITFPSS